MRNMKMLGLLAVSAMALAAFVGTSSASAAAKFTFGAMGEALQENTLVAHAFTVTGAEAECGVSAFAFSAGKEVTEQLAGPVYTDCTAFGGFDATVHTHECELRFKAATTGEHATVGLQGCGTGTAEDKTKGIQITVKVPFIGECIVDIPEQTIEKAASYKNTSAPNSIDIKFTASGLMVDVTKSTGLCPLTVGTHSGANGGSYTGESNISTTNGVKWDAS